MLVSTVIERRITMSFTRLVRAASAAALLVAAPAGWSAFDPVNDDTDIFLANPAFTASRPNVLIVVDNSANWGQNTGEPSPWDTKYNGVKNALVAIGQDSTIINSSYNIGLGIFAETGGNNNNTGGGYIRYGIRQMTGDPVDATSNRGRLIQIINNFDKSTGTGDGTNNTDYSLGMFEFYSYFAGISSYAGHGKDKADAGGSVYVTGIGRVPQAASPLPAGAEVKTSGALAYTSPITDGCQKNFIIFISNGESTDPNSQLTVAQAKLAGITGSASPTQIPISPNFEQGVWGDEYAKFMANSDCNASFAGVQNVITYTIDVLPGTTGHGLDHTAMLKSMAINGKGKYFAVTDTSSTAQLQGFLKTILQEVQAVNSVFASTTLPVSVNVRGTNLNQVYIGVFRPDPNKSPRWLGNLKLYKLGVDTATQNLFLADSTGAPAENASTGFISGNAKSFWTASSSFWSYRDSTLNGVGGPSDTPDGDLVEKGGSAQRLRVAYPGPIVASPDNTARKIYTCPDTTAIGTCVTTGLSATPFNATNVTAADVGTFVQKPVVQLTSTATTARAKVTGHGWSTGNTVKVSGATPGSYNTTKPITVIDADTIEYALDTLPDATRARVTAVGHGLSDNDLAYIVDYPAYAGCGYCWPPPGYSGIFVPVVRIDADHFDYTPAEPQTVPIVSPNISGLGGRVPTLVVGAIGSSTAIISLPGHGLVGTLPNSYLYPTGAADWWFGYNDNLTVVDPNTLEIPTYYGAIPGTNGAIPGPGDVALVTTQVDHPFVTGQSVTLKGSLLYTGAQLVTKIDNRRFFFSSTAAVGDASVTNPRTLQAGAAIASITHPTTGSGAARDIATVTTTAPHGLTATAPASQVQIFGTGAPFTTAVACVGYDTGTGAGQVASWTVLSVPTTTTFTISNGNVDSCPASLTSATLPNMIAGVGVNSIQPSRLSASGMVVLRYLNITLASPLTSASGTILAGRPADADNAARDALVAWARSADNRDNENLNAFVNDVRASVHGDVLHSRPATINYNRYGDDNDIYAYYGSNDGIFHAVKGGIAAHASGPDSSLVPGSERWGFLPKEFFPRLNRLREQTPTISAATPKDYFFDGSIGVYLKDAKGNGTASSPINCVPGSCSGADTTAGVLGDNIHPTAGDKVHLYLTLRRGGNFMYALNVLNPAAPTLLWRKGAGDPGWDELGQTWSEPKVTRVLFDLGNTNNPDNVVLIFGAGYDDAVDDINPCLLAEWYGDRVVQKAIGAGTVTYTATGSCTISSPSGVPTTFTRKFGRGMLVVDAFSGDVVWQAGVAPTGAAYNLTVAGMNCGIPSDITVLDKNRDGFADRLYVGDTCGNIWRADISDPDVKNWSVTQVATLSGTGATTLTNKRKFLFPPDLVFATDANGNYTAVLLGSGDREHPFDGTVLNGFFMIKDRDDAGNSIVGAANATTVSINVPSPDTGLATPVTTATMFDATAAVVDNAAPASLNGWFVILGTGEKVVGSAVTISGTTFFNTNQPSATAGGGACSSNLGIAREYLVGFADAAATVDLNGLGSLSIANRSTVHAGGGYLPSPVPVVVEIDGKKYQAVISGTSVQTPPGLTLEKRTRAFWYKQID
jgi:Tfp pilus tip-associated adhesin PilY1